MTLKPDEKEQHTPKRPSLSLTREARLENALEAIKRNSKEFYSKWEPRMNGHPLIGFAYECKLIAEEALK